VIARGRLVAHAPIAELVARAGARTRVRAPEAERLRELLEAAGIHATVTEDGLLLVDGPAERVGEIAAANAVVLHELGTESSSLEEVFLELTATEEATPG
jgi:ABC-2 type transport system ATP-binding protein